MPELLFDKTKDIEIVLQPSNGLPTSEEMKALANRHSSEEWDKLCSSKNFLHELSFDIRRAKILTEKILAGKGDVLTKEDLNRGSK